MPAHAHATLLGHVGIIGELKTINDNPRIGFTLAVNRRVKDTTGEWTDKPSWFRVRVYGRPASRLAEDLRKGDLVMVAGRLYVDSWKRRDGSTATDTYVDPAEVSVCRHSQGNTSATAHDAQSDVAPPTPPATPPSMPAPAPAAGDDQPPF